MRTLSQRTDLAKWARPALIYFLVENCLSVTVDLARNLEKHYGLSVQDVDRLSIRSIPSDIENLIASHACLEWFGPDGLIASNLFYKLDRTGGECLCLEWRDDCVCSLPCWRLDINPAYQRRGFLFPVRDKRRGHFTDLLCFRHARDERPFSVELRAERKAAA